MTPAEMPAGGEMDAEVARRVMGWLPRAYHGPIIDFGDRCVVKSGHEIMSGGRRISFHPSTRIDDAWLVVDRLRDLLPSLPIQAGDDNPWFALDAPNPRTANDGPWRLNWIAGFRTSWDCEGDGWVSGYRVLAPTAPLAICRAALTACPPGLP